MDSNNVTIKDIARLAGVSIGTVDRVIHNRGNVSVKSLNKIMAVLNTTGYKPNLIARSLGSKKKHVIATLTPDPTMDEYWEQSYAGILEAKGEWMPYNVEVKNFHFDLYNKNSFKDSAREVLESQPEAILASPIFHHEGMEFFEVVQKRAIPYVLFNSNIPEARPLCFIGQNLYQGGRLCAELLDMSSHGPCTYAVLHVYEDIQNSTHLAEKERGFRDYFKDKGDESIKIKVLDFGTPDKQWLKKELRELFKDSTIKGLQVTTSKGAFMTARYLEKFNRADIRVVGYDLLSRNIQYLKKGVIDFLIHQNPQRQAALGISYLANHLIFKKEVPPNNYFPLEVITRENADSFLESAVKYQLK